MRLSQVNKRPQSESEMKSVILQIASDIAISIMPFEDEQRNEIIRQALEFAQNGETVRDLYRLVDSELKEG